MIQLTLYVSLAASYRLVQPGTNRYRLVRTSAMQNLKLNNEGICVLEVSDRQMKRCLLGVTSHFFYLTGVAVGINKVLFQGGCMLLYPY